MMCADDDSGREAVEDVYFPAVPSNLARRLHPEWRDPLPIAEASAGLQRLNYRYMRRGPRERPSVARPAVAACEMKLVARYTAEERLH